MVHRDELDSIRSRLIEKQGDLTEELRLLPEGELMVTEQKGCRRYLQRLPAVGNRKKERRYGVKKDAELLNDLVRKEYVKKALKNTEKNIATIDRAIKGYRPVDENSIMSEFTERYPELLNGVYRRKKDEDKWKERFNRIDNFHSESLNQTAADGVKMRSKNEVYISSRLDHYNLTYRSDCPTGIPGLYRVPDFTILRKRDDKIIYWEHMGMMYDTEYRIDNKRKLEEYEAAGIVPWDNLIITYDTLQGGLRADLIEAMIRAWLL